MAEGQLICVPSLSKEERIRKYGEVFTPQWVVELMCDELDRNSPGCFDPSTTFLEPACGAGVFVLEILRRKFRNCRCRRDFTVAIRSVYAFDIQEGNVRQTIENVSALCREFFTPTKAEQTLIRDHVIQADALKIMKMWDDPALKEMCQNKENQ